MSTSASYSSAAVGSIASNSASSTLDCNHPYYLHPSDNPGMQVTTVVLNDTNYNQWHRSMEIALASKLKLGFVDGSYTQPPTNSPLLIYWLRCNNIIISWILNSVSIDIRNSIVYLKSARTMWLDLEDRFVQRNVPKLFNLRKEISHLTQGSMSISSYFTKFRTINDESDCIVTKPRCTCNLCTCAVNKKLLDMDLNEQLTQFLMGLNETYTGLGVKFY